MTDATTTKTPVTDLPGLSRRFFVLAAPAVLAGCVTNTISGDYGPRQEGSVALPAMDMEGINPK